jgi:hypothetical protein
MFVFMNSSATYCYFGKLLDSLTMYGAYAMNYGTCFLARNVAMWRMEYMCLKVCNILKCFCQLEVNVLE